ncbi:SCP-2 sterol transfer family protein [Haloechinothrix alba]|uniref:SCP-2 sterol transfer family protein n=1 Tax=Haloechinothrix alba TaxID=664784 RepID=A0A238XY75_9PSEU|nr:SCP2 sterol-binding domain-containing protein [Haloechinothrix alba]SNR63383.1 SCP-2 sterol transfer family protein [Haloechinothrix alba]
MGTAEKVYKLISRLPETSVAVDDYRTVGAVTRFVIDDRQEVLIDHDGEVVETGRSGDPDITVRLSSTDVIALVAGDLSLTRMVTSGRLVAEGPIFQSIGVVRAIGRLSDEGE